MLISCSRILLSLSLGWFAGSVLASEWAAECNNLKFEIRGHSAVLKLITDQGAHQIGSGELLYEEPGNLVHFKLYGNATGSDGRPLTEIRLDKMRGKVSVIYRNPLTGEQSEGDFCNTSIDYRRTSS